MRKDYFRNYYTFVTKKDKQKLEEVLSSQSGDYESCPFCLGSEKLNPVEITRITKGSHWQVRVFPNPNPLTAEVKEEPKSPWKHEKTESYEEIIVDTPNHFQRTHQLEIGELKILLGVIKERVKEVRGKDKVEYVSVFQNCGFWSGATDRHSHFQLVAFAKTPPKIKEKIHQSSHGSCVYCHIVSQEENSPRKVLENNSFLAFCPWAPEQTHELWIAPKKHLRNLNDLSDRDMLALAEIFKGSLEAVNRICDDYSVIFNIGPEGENFHFHIEIFPYYNERYYGNLKIREGYYFVTNTPEQSAKIYRGEA